ncbi:DUF1460 domain-containing protein [Pseudanabaenaceae cyanobacterium LEGE 13415]|nr:DUF1460 domain-containing protein [Pseudanabaenaceae cyanobacterium LEGE 13415]
MKKLYALTTIAFLLSFGTNLEFRSESPQITLQPVLISAAVPSEPLAKADQRIFQRINRIAVEENWHRRSLGEITQAIAEQFIGTPYAEGLLDRSKNETLFTSLREFDCVLFVESVLAMARGISSQNYSSHTFTKHLQQQRYENGEINGYCSRLHYFSYWIEDNQRRGIVTDITKDLGGISLGKRLNFMSTNWKKYPKLVASEKEHQCIEQMEARLNATTVNYIPTNQIRSRYRELKSGDILAIATRVPGLDVTHTGFVYRGSNGEVGIIHAAPGRGVKISPDLETYLNRVEDAIGVIVARPN